MKRILSSAWHEILRFDENEDVLGGILEFAGKHKIESAWLSAIGSSKEIELGFYHLDKKEYANKVFSETLELVELSGILALTEEKQTLHLHGSFSRPDYSTIGGHVQRLIANATVEVFIHKLNEPLTRKKDPETGLKLLD